MPDTCSSNAVANSLRCYDSVPVDPVQAQQSSYMRNPWRNSTTRMVLQGQHGARAQDGRPLGEKRTFFMGPGVQLSASSLRAAYPERAVGKVHLDKSLDPREILRAYNAGTLGGGTPRPQTAPVGRAGPLVPSSSQLKSVVFDGRGAAVVTGVPGNEFGRPQAGGGPPSLATTWEAPRVKHEDLAVGAPLGHEELPGSPDTRLIGSKHRHISGLDAKQSGHAPLEADGPQPQAPCTPSSTLGQTSSTLGRTGALSRSMLTASGREGMSLSPLLQARQTLARSVQEYALSTKPVSHTEYEQRCNLLTGIGCWEQTQCVAASSMHVGRPSNLMSPLAHTQHLSLRRPATTRGF